MNSRNKKNWDISPFRWELLNENTGFLFLQLTNLWQYGQERILKMHFGLSQTQYAIMASLHWLTLQGSEVTQSELAQHCKIEKMTLSNNITKLVGRGYLTVNTHSNDARANAVLVTEKGKELLQKAVIDIENMDERFFHSLNSAKLKSFNETLITLVQANNFYY